MKNFSALIKAMNSCLDAPEKEIDERTLLLKEICYTAISCAMDRSYLKLRKHFSAWIQKGITREEITKLSSRIYAMCTTEYEYVYPCFPVKIDDVEGNIDAIAKARTEYHGLIFDFSLAKRIDYLSNQIDITIGAMKKMFPPETNILIRVFHIDGTSKLIPGDGSLFDIATTMLNMKARRRGSWCKECEIGCNPINLPEPIPARR